jgi:hypothetical protein
VQLVDASLYRQADKDIRSGSAPIRVVRKVSIVGAASGFGLTFDIGPAITGGVPVVERDRVLLLDMLTYSLVAGAGQKALAMDIHTIDETGASVFKIIDDFFGAAAAAPETIGRTTPFGSPLVISPGEGIQLTASFNTGVLANTVTALLWGRKVPRGNWQFG